MAYGSRQHRVFEGDEDMIDFRAFEGLMKRVPKK